MSRSGLIGGDVLLRDVSNQSQLDEAHGLAPEETPEVVLRHQDIEFSRLLVLREGLDEVAQRHLALREHRQRMREQNVV